MDRSITKERVLKVADIAKIHLTEQEAEEMQDHLHSFLEYATQLHEINTEDVIPTTHIYYETNILRKDDAKHVLTQEEAIKNAPDQQDGYFKVPSILG